MTPTALRIELKRDGEMPLVWEHGWPDDSSWEIDPDDVEALAMVAAHSVREMWEYLYPQAAS